MTRAPRRSLRWPAAGVLGMGASRARTLLGRLGYLRVPKWVDDGHADYVARDIDLAQALQGFKAGAPELDPARSGLYVRYQLMVAEAGLQAW